jgi:hypothetical protein
MMMCIVKSKGVDSKAFKRPFKGVFKAFLKAFKRPLQGL